MATQEEPQDHFAPSKSERPHLLFLDGIRGLAALYVVFGHASHWLIWWARDHNQSSIWLKLFRVFSFPHYAVDMFIVLSGFCLMLPLVNKGTIGEKFGFFPYIQRRFKRIYPPYLAALLLTLALIFVAHRLIPAGGVINDVLTPGNFFSHLFLLHNLSPLWARSLGNDPLWSVATEWQIYFLFPWLLLPTRRLFGRCLTIVVALLFGWGALFASNFYLAEGAPWLIGLFAMGMVGAELAFSKDEKLLDLQRKIPWLPLALFGAVALILFRGFSDAVIPGGFNNYQYIADPIFGIIAMSFLIGLATGKGRLLHSIGTKVFESSPALFFGRYSYSIYLFHFPLLHLIVDPLCQRWNLNLQQRIFAGLIFIPCALFITYIFHLLFEAPFLNTRKKSLIN